jgi:hypothetical protein
MLTAASGGIYSIASVAGRRRHGLFEEDQVLPVTVRRSREPMVKYVVRVVRDVTVFSVAIASQVGFQNGGVKGAVAVALLGGDRAVEARGFARRVAAAEWLVGKILIFLLVEGLVKQYWT